MESRLFVFLFLTGLCAQTHCRPHQYHFISTTLSWLKAQTYCREHYTDLATVFDIEDMKLILESSEGVMKMAWIGLHDNLTNWRWSLSDTLYYREKEDKYRAWDYGQPDNFFGDELCVTMLSGGVWDDSRCFLRYPFICYDGTSQRFIFVEQEMSWFDAVLYCRRLYTDLASVRNMEESYEIRRVAKNMSVWIGLFRTKEWSDRSQSNYSYWKEGQPDNLRGGENCIATDLSNTGLWSDEVCSNELAFICYEKTDMPVLTTTTAARAATSNSITTAENLNKITTDGNSTNTVLTTFGHVSAEVTSYEQPSTTEEDQTTIIGATSSEITTAEMNLSSPERTSSVQFSTSELDQATSTMTPIKEDQMTSREGGSISTDFPDVSSSAATTSATTSSTNTVTPNKIMTTDGNSTSAVLTSQQEPTSIPDQTQHKSQFTMNTTTLITYETPTTEIEPTTGYVSTEITPYEQPSTTVEDLTRITSMTSGKTTTAEMTLSSPERTSSVQFSTSELDQTASTMSPMTADQMTSREGGSVSTDFPDVSSTTATTTAITSSTNTVTPNKIMTTDGNSTSTVLTSQQKPTSVPDQTQHKSQFTMNTTTLITYETPTTEIEPTTGYVSTEITPYEQPSTTVEDLTRITSMTSSKTTTAEMTLSSPERTSSVQFSTSELDQTASTMSPMTADQMTSREGGSISTDFPDVSSTTATTTAITSSTNTVTPNKIMTTDGNSTSAVLTSQQEPTSIPDQTQHKSQFTINTTTLITYETPTTEIEPTTGYVSTEITPYEQPSTTVEDLTRITSTTSSQITTAERNLTSPERTSSVQFSTSELDQSASTTDQTTQKSQSIVNTTTVNTNKRSTTETETTTGHVGAEVTSYVQPSTTEEDQTRTITSEAPVSPLLSTITTSTVTPSKITTAETNFPSQEMTPSLHFSTSDVDQNTVITDRSLYKSQYTSTVATTDHLSTEVTPSELPSTKLVDQTIPVTENLVNLKLTITSTIPLSQDDIRELVMVEFHRLLTEMGLPAHINVRVKKPLK
ncbi:serine-rich adhesin for platelets-like isoform X2 [Mugil cephalus]|uniref:serine-rich adhesin for platelets-like isoform X2 n=1 Tax=Mugil cephalus TaxID=48193 RepID=UPI001FB60326|nr:serine-rich adhesin for platelets-like isoform X2 [Mugil cephalus]